MCVCVCVCAPNGDRNGSHVRSNIAIDLFIFSNYW